MSMNFDRDLSGDETAALDAAVEDLTAEQEAGPVEDGEAGTTEEVEVEETQEQAEELPTYTVKVDGKELVVTLDELQKGYSRTEDYTRKTEEVAEQRRAVEAAKQAAESERTRYLQSIENVLHVIQQADPIISEGQKTDWVKEAQADPTGTQEKYFRYQQRLAQVNYLSTQRAAEIQRAQSEHMAREEKALLDAVPEWRADTEKAKADLNDIRAGLVSAYGFKPEDVATLPNHRMVLVARDAMKYRAGLAARREAEAKRKTAEKGPTLTPGTATKDRGNQGMRNRALRTNSPADVAEYAMRLLTE